MTTISPVELAGLNELLGRELGRRADGHSIFAWRNSDGLFWPAHRTGRSVVTRVEVPLVLPVEVDCPYCQGTGFEPWTDEIEPCSGCEGARRVVKTSDITETVLPEYVRDRQVRALDTWVMTKWLNAADLIWGWVGRHGISLDPAGKDAVPVPGRDVLARLWEERFPGADFPSRGWRIPTDASLPRGPGMSRVPTLSDTRYFIACVREQTRLGFGDRLRDMDASVDRASDALRREQEDVIRDAFGAYLNPRPGARGGFLSLPWTRRDRS